MQLHDSLDFFAREKPDHRCIEARLLTSRARESEGGFSVETAASGQSFLDLPVITGCMGTRVTER